MKRVFALLMIFLFLVSSISLALAATVKATVKVVGVDGEEAEEQDIGVNLGCIAGEKKGEEYCSINSIWTTEKDDGAACEQDYECKIGSCVDEVCAEPPSLWQRIVNWFRGLFIRADEEGTVADEGDDAEDEENEESNEEEEAE